MTFVDRGAGPVVVFLPGIQGRWEWHRPTIEALAARCRVLTFSLADERGTGAWFDPRSCVDSYCAQVQDVMSRAGAARATICGISYGGLVAATFAARHPELTDGLVLVSALPPGWQPDARARWYLRAPRMLAPVFVIASLRLLREIRAASRGPLEALFTATSNAANALTHMFSPGKMARRARQLSQASLETVVRTTAAPVLVIVGDAALDRVVPVSETLDYLRLLPQAKAVTLADTGHLGSVTRPREFADLVASFAARCQSPPIQETT